MRQGGEIIKELVYLKNNEPVCDSLQVSEKFHKNHQHVLESIDKLTVENSTVAAMFHADTYKADNGHTYRKIYMNRDGFSLLVMGFTGKKALEWKLQYIEAFNKMESIIREKSTLAWEETRRAGKLTRQAETDTIKRLVEYAKEQGSTHSDKLYMAYSKLANKIAGISSREEATITQLNNLLLLCLLYPSPSPRDRG